ncbi:MAG TPA: hypothetical protein VHP33_04585 [Polyangiaceae bacterium]|nr:hypothetical protein [Polyangiaceae bacterium]
MEPETRPRVLTDTMPSRLGRFFALALVLHVPFSPIVGLLGLVHLLGTNEVEGPPPPPLTEIPLDLFEDDDAPSGKPAATPEAQEPAAVAEPEAALPPEPDPVVVKPKKPKELPDAGAPEPVDAGVPDASKTSDAGAADDAASPGDAGPERKPGEGIGSPVAGIGDKRVVDPNAHVQVLIQMNRVRQHPLGNRVGPLLRNVYQWRDFFGPTAIDPVRDLDRMLIVGSQLRDSSGVVAILEFNVPQERIRSAVDVLVSRDPQGGWLDGGVPAAMARADRGERVFVLPAPRLLVVAPPAILEAARKFKRLPRELKGDEIALLHLDTPANAFLGLPVVIPKSIRSADVRLSPRADGGVIIDILAHDETEPLARSDAQALTQALTAATSLNLGLFGSVLFGSSQKKFIEKGSFEADGADIRGEIVLSRDQVVTVLELASGFLTSRSPKPRASATSTPSALPTPPVVPTPPVSPAPAASP